MEIKDITGLEPIAEAVKTTVDKSYEGLGAFLSAVFMPGLQEIGYMINDKVRYWRLCNVLKVLDKAKGKMMFYGNEIRLLANPRVGLSIIEESSKVDDEELQEMWAGLFASSCTNDGKDDSNIIFVDLLKRISGVEARILKYGCENCKKEIYPNGLILGEEVSISLDMLKRITGIDDIYRLDRELDHMRALSLIIDSTFGPSGGFTASDSTLTANISPSALALNLYYKVYSFGITIKEFWKDSLEYKSIDGKQMV